MFGGRCIKHWASTQTTFALSSGEAELNGLCKGASMGLGLKAVASDLGINYALTVQTDATAAMGMARRGGIGKVRHLDVSLLWVQERVKAKSFKLQKVLGDENVADAMTKYLERPALEKHLKGMNLVAMEGRAASAPALPTN